MALVPDDPQSPSLFVCLFVFQSEESVAQVLRSRVSEKNGRLHPVMVRLLLIVSWRTVAHKTARPN